MVTASPVKQTQDCYPSRQLSDVQHIQRLDPVLHLGENAAGPLTQSELNSFSHNGYVICENVFTSPETSALEESLNQLEACDAQRVFEPESSIVRSLFSLHRGTHLPARLLRDPRIVNRVEQILGPQVYIHQSRANRKPAFDGKEFWWHSDFETWHVEDGMPRMRALSVMVFLSDNTPTNGPLFVIPGSHQTFISCVGKTPENHYQQSLQRQEYGTPDRASLSSLADSSGVHALCGPSGSLVLFDCNLLHGSPNNISPLSRLNIFGVYNHITNKLVEPFCGLRPRPTHLAERHADPIKATPLEMNE